jgi:hypothetical protein
MNRIAGKRAFFDMWLSILHSSLAVKTRAAVRPGRVQGKDCAVYVRTTSSLELLEFIDKLKWMSDKLHVFNMNTSPLGRVCPVLVLASPRVTSPEQAAKSGKTVVYLEGNIHPYESEAKEALLLLTREILLGRMTHLLEETRRAGTSRPPSFPGDRGRGG